MLFIKLLIVIVCFLGAPERILVTAIGIDELDCSFKEDFCDVWTNVSSEWKRNQYSHGDFPHTGPDRDKDGNFYIHSSKKSSGTDADFATLESKKITNNQNSGTTCFRFWYYMSGVDVQSLTVSLNGSNEFTRRGNQSKQWLCGVIDITEFNGKISFEAGRSIEPFSVIALDYFQVIAATSCSNCETLEGISTAISSKTTSSSTTSSNQQTTVDGLDTVDPGGGVTDQLPIAVGVPAGVLIAGVIIVTVCICKRRSSKDGHDIRRQSTLSNQYTGGPRTTYDDGEIYNELDENNMIDGGTDNGGYIDPTPEYAEPDEVDIMRSNGHVRYKKESKETSSDDYITPIAGNGNLRHSTDDYMNPISASDSQNNDYLEPQFFTEVDYT